MPTLILLDVSLSMARGWRDGIGNDSSTPSSPHSMARSNILALAQIGINTLLDFFATNCKLEYVSLLQFSSLWESLAPFTRDYQLIREKLKSCTVVDKTCLEAGLIGAAASVTDDWDSGTPVQVIVITDGNSGIGSSSLANLVEKWSKSNSAGNATSSPNPDGSNSNRSPLPLPFSSKLHFVLLAPNKEPHLKSVSLYEKLIEINGGQGSVFHPDSPNLSNKVVQAMIQKLADKYFQPFYGLLKCGHMAAKIQLYPPPMLYEKQLEFKRIRKEMSSVLDILGFMNTADVASPPSVSRHLLLPIPQKPTEGLGSASTASSPGKESSLISEAEQLETEAKTPSLTVLLHGSLRRENKVAFVIVGDEWYGMVYSWANSKKKSNLMISLLEPGTDTLPWLGDLDKLTPASDFSEDKSPYADDKSPFPVSITEKKSYSQNCVVWIKPDRLQTDIQKILRHARKLPDKIQNFYKELNRLRRAALSFGFLELLEGMSRMLEREYELLRNTNPEAALQLNHAAQALRDSSYRDISQNIIPLKSNFAPNDQ